MTSESNNPLLVGVTEFCNQTGLSKPIFYKLKKKMIAVGAMGKGEKKIDLNCAWMQNYLARNGTGNRRHLVGDSKPSEPKEQSGYWDKESAPEKPPAPKKDTTLADELPPMAELLHVEQFEKVRKSRIDNETKLKKLAPIELVEYMFGTLDDFFIKLIMDGESSVCPAIYEKASHDGTLEDTRREYRTYTERLVKMTKARLAKKLKGYKP